jgi:hypothetical protein
MIVHPPWILNDESSESDPDPEHRPHHILKNFYVAEIARCRN